MKGIKTFGTYQEDYKYHNMNTYYEKFVKEYFSEIILYTVAPNTTQNELDTLQ